jgi:hypothetical protein
VAVLAEDRNGVPVLDLVLGADHAVAEPVGRPGVLHRHERATGVARLVQLAVVPDATAVVVEQLLDGVLADHPGQEVVHDDPLVVPSCQPLRLGEGPSVVDEVVVQLEERDVKLRDDQILVVAGVTEVGGAHLVESCRGSCRGR